jgi:FixJ family two-component response regulator
VTETAARLAVVDDDPSVRQSFLRLLRVAGHHPEAFGCARDFLAYPSLEEFRCILLDVELPDLNGLEIQAALERLDYTPPIVFITGHGDIPMTVRAIQAGAVDFLTKPCAADRILAAVDLALDADAERRRRRRALADERARLETLTPREYEVFAAIVQGLRNKQIAANLGIGEKTVKVHRAHLMAKLAVRSVADLVRIAERAGMDDQPAPRG